jgi:hypothetical protein
MQFQPQLLRLAAALNAAQRSNVILECKHNTSYHDSYVMYSGGSLLPVVGTVEWFRSMRALHPHHAAVVWSAIRLRSARCCAGSSTVCGVSAHDGAAYVAVDCP